MSTLKYNILIFSALYLLLMSGFAGAQVGGPISSSQLNKAQSQAQAQAIHSYWTPERMANAQPLPTPTAIVTRTDQTGVYQATEMLGAPTLINGHPPGGGVYTRNAQALYSDEPTPQTITAPQAFGPGPSNPTDYDGYGKFQRWTMQGKYVIWPRSVHGKLFFSFGASNFVCSATVTNRSTIITAGHCVNDGAESFATDILFCPGYNQGGPNAIFGCWSGLEITTSSPWHTSGNPDYDYACVVMAATGVVQADKIGNVTGWAGRAFNFPPEQAVITFGYPAAPPFSGLTIQQTASVEWYELNFGAGGLDSKVIGSDLTGGASGGGWFLSWRAPGAEIVDTDGSPITDPVAAVSGPHINGVNSHKRCTVNCNSPPSDLAGVFWQEMTSPPFWSDDPDVDLNDSEDVFAVCNGHVNNDA